MGQTRLTKMYHTFGKFRLISNGDGILSSKNVNSKVVFCKFQNLGLNNFKMT